MIEKIYTPQFGEFDAKKAVIEAHEKINELVDEANRQEKNLLDTLDTMIKLGDTLHKLLDKLGFHPDPNPIPSPDSPSDDPPQE